MPTKSKPAKEWPCKCGYIKWDNQIVFTKPAFYFVMYLTSHRVPDVWQLCPICGATRPKAKKKGK